MFFLMIKPYIFPYLPIYFKKVIFEQAHQAQLRGHKVPRWQVHKYNELWTLNKSAAGTGAPSWFVVRIELQGERAKCLQVGEQLYPNFQIVVWWVIKYLFSSSKPKSKPASIRILKLLCSYNKAISIVLITLFFIIKERDNASASGQVCSQATQESVDKKHLVTSCFCGHLLTRKPFPLRLGDKFTPHNVSLSVAPWLQLPSQWKASLVHYN